MALQLMTGLPGSGKSSRLIKRVKSALSEGRRVATFACSDSAWMRTRPYVADQRILGCRERGLTCKLDHFVSSAEAAQLLASLPVGTLVAFEEAHAFSADIATHWSAASRRGLDLIISMPSSDQLSRLNGSDCTI